MVYILKKNGFNYFVKKLKNKAKKRLKLIISWKLYFVNKLTTVALIIKIKKFKTTVLINNYKKKNKIILTLID